MHRMTVKFPIHTAFIFIMLSGVFGCKSTENIPAHSVPLVQNRYQGPIEVYYEATPVASQPKAQSPSSRFKLASFRREEQEGPFQKLSKPKKESDGYQVWSHATIHLQYPHPSGKKGYVLSTVKVQRETPPRMFEENRPAPIKTQINKMQRTSGQHQQSLFRLASSSKPTIKPQIKKSEYEIWKLDIPLEDVTATFQKLTMNSNSIKYSDNGNSRLHWQQAENNRVSMRCDNLPFVEKIIQRTYHDGELAGFRFN